MVTQTVPANVGKRAMSNSLSKLSTEGMAKALRMFGTIQTVTYATPLIAEVDAARIEAAIDQSLVKCTQHQATTLVVELLGAYPDFVNTRRSEDDERDYKIYLVKLVEAMMQFSPDIGKAAVHGGTGIPAKMSFKPRATDIILFGKAELEKRQNVKTMLARHRAEAERRRKEKAAEKDFTRTPEMQKRIADEIERLRVGKNFDPLALQGRSQP
jgi:hypothetical protein